MGKISEMARNGQLVPPPEPVSNGVDRPARISPDQAVRLECLRLATGMGISIHEKLIETAGQFYDFVVNGKPGAQR